MRVKLSMSLHAQNRQDMKEENLVVIRVYDSVNEAEWDKSLLDSAGIWAMIRNEIMSALYPTGVMPAELVVRSADKARAQEVLEAYSAE